MSHGLHAKQEKSSGKKNRAREWDISPTTGLENCWLPKGNSMRTRRGWVEPEVFFRIVHAAQVGHHGDPAATHREQTVEIALGPKGAFENGNIGAPTRRMATARVVSAVPPSRGNPKPPREPKTPRVVDLLRKAIEWRSLLDAGKIANQTEIARQEGIPRARVTQIMGMLRLAPKIQKHILSLPEVDTRPSVTERVLRPIEAITNQSDQLKEFHKLMM